MQCATCGLTTDTKRERKAHSIATGHDAYVPTAAAMAAYEAAKATAPVERTHYVSPLTLWVNRRRA